jgi:nucleoid-associated protein YgaU
MPRTDLCGSSKPHIHRRVSLRQPLRCGFTILICSCLFAGAAQCRARAPQDVAEAARQERARREQAKKQKHVYTDEDLLREKILTPEDEAIFEADRKEQAQPAEQQAEVPIEAYTGLAQLPLGDIARRYRNAKQAAEAATPFHLPFDEPVFAAPVISVPNLEPPRPTFSPAHANVMPVRPDTPAVAPQISGSTPVRRIDPFTRRLAPSAPPSISPIAPPVVHPRTLPPVVTPSQHNAAPAIASSAAKSSVAPSIAHPPTIAKASFSRHTVIVQPGDSLWKLAQQNLGRGTRWQELMAANPGIVDPTRITPGTEIVVPARVTGLKSDLKVTVKDGDTLSRIARATYGYAAAWRCIAQANPEIADANRIYKGQQLLVPFRCQQ